jgi:LysR family nod box-dependent transcriptional activator
MQNFDLNLLASLDALLAEKSVTRAARKTHVAQSTMSGTLRRLRDQFDDQLLVRYGRRYELSPLAQSLAISVRQILLQIESTVSSRPLFNPGTDKRRFRIMASDYRVMVYLSAVFRRTERLAPHLSFDIVPINSPLDSIRSGAVDLCITGNPDIRFDVESDQLLRSDVLFYEVYCCVVARDHPLREAVTLDQFFQYPRVVAQFSGVTMATSGLRANGAQNRTNPVINVAGFSVIPTLVSGTSSIGIMPSRMLDAAPTQGNLRKLDTAFDMPSFTERLVWHSRFAYDPAFCWLRSVMLGVT